MHVAIKLKSLEFRREREASWSELESLIERVERRGIGSLGASELARLPALYRAALSSLSVARSISLDKNLIDYLESLTQRAYFVVYGVKRHLRDALARFFGFTLPTVVRRLRWFVAVSALLVVLGTTTGYLLVQSDEDRFYSFVSAELANGRDPTASTEDLRAVLYHEGFSSGHLADFSAFLFSHNSQVTILAFALGFLIGIPSLWLMFTNGLMLGAFVALYSGRGLGVEVWAWLLAHGVSELTAMIFGGAGGLVLAQALLVPGPYGRLEQLARRGRDAGTLLVGAVIMLFVAGLIEGVFRQTVQSVPIRYAVAAGTAVFWGWYFLFVGRRGPGARA